ncbi:hypothetical protein CMV_023305 [Castanea mollissima]|uniref:Uncharacterized protein n=1 Tax=Castanea mollissima TaxID=60419 RepID=A0A8J4VIY8_9ROSI|nr:hypothetical protein CMV_023305 [Castanea mollissima]
MLHNELIAGKREFKSAFTHAARPPHHHGSDGVCSSSALASKLLRSIIFKVILTSSFFLHILKVQFTEKRIQIGGKQQSSLFLASISLLSEQVPFAEKDLAVGHRGWVSWLLVVLWWLGRLILVKRL